MIASDDIGGTIKLWDARPLTPEIRVELEAYGLVQFYLEKKLTKAEAINRLHAHKAITEEVRKEVLRMAELCWKVNDSLRQGTTGP